VCLLAAGGDFLHFNSQITKTKFEKLIIFHENGSFEGVLRTFEDDFGYTSEKASMTSEKASNKSIDNITLKKHRWKKFSVFLMLSMLFQSDIVNAFQSDVIEKHWFFWCHRCFRVVSFSEWCHPLWARNHLRTPGHRCFFEAFSDVIDAFRVHHQCFQSDVKGLKLSGSQGYALWKSIGNITLKEHRWVVPKLPWKVRKSPSSPPFSLKFSFKIRILLS